MGNKRRERFVRTEDGTVRANLTWRTWLIQVVLGWLVSAYIWLVRWTCRIRVVHGQEQLDAAVNRQVFIPCGWHQRLFISGIFLLTLQPKGVRIGFLISPSREGEFIARVARAHGTQIMRGSSTRTGREAITDMRRALGRGISPMIFADGPNGPPGDFKPGAVVLSRRADTPVLPIGCGIDRYWEMPTWDRTRIPKPFARFTVALGTLRTPDPVSPDSSVDGVRQSLATELDELTAIADRAV